MSSKCCKWFCSFAALLFSGLAIVPFLECSELAESQEAASSALKSLKRAETATDTVDEQMDEGHAIRVSGMIKDETGAIIEGARVRLLQEGQPDQDRFSDHDGEFSFNRVIAGAFELNVMCGGFATLTYSGILRMGQDYVIPPISLIVAGTSASIDVAMSRTEVAEAELKDEEGQRIAGALPNFYVTYDSTAPPLTPKQKFKLAWKATTDPINVVVTAGIGAMGQATNSSPEFGQGATGYAKRFAAAYADSVTGTLLGGAILPSIFRQDPRYFYKGSGPVHSRILYALSRAVVCRNDKGQWQTNYSALAGDFASAGISNVYYRSDRSGAVSTVNNALVGIGSSAVTNLLQEFVFRRLTPHPPNYAPEGR